MKQVIIYYIVGLFGDVQFEGEYFCSFIFDAARRFVDIGSPIFVKGVADEITIFVVTVEPKIGRFEILFVGEFTLDLEIGKVIVFASFLTSL